MSTRRIKINRLLVPIDFSPLSLGALEFASFIAGSVKADITSLHVSEKLAEKGENSKEGIEQRLRQQWETLETHLPLDPSIQHQVRVAEGKIHENILLVADEEQTDLLVMGTNGIARLNPLTRFFLGSNTNRTVQASPLPVLTLREVRRPVKIRDILLPLDLTRQTQGKVNLAINMARLFDSRLHLVAVSDYFESLQGKTPALERMMEEQAAKIKAHSLEVSTEVIRHDDVAHSVVGYADEIEADLILIVTAQETKLDSLLMGTRAARVIATAHRPVLSVRPRNLETLYQQDS
ncbi:MAG: hypothetical protein GC205_07510 [Bacteroidetes bacterium]|nr:hypothetical protein [Bacteroidota bacterium]